MDLGLLCHSCRGIALSGWSGYHTNLEYAEKAGKLEGCRTCLLAYRAVTELNMRMGDGDDHWVLGEVRFSRLGTESPNLQLCLKYWNTNTHRMHSRQLNLFTTEDMSSSWEFAPLIPKRTLQFGRTSSEEAIVWTRAMLRKCQDNHFNSHCQPALRPRLPTRILDLGGINSATHARSISNRGIKLLVTTKAEVSPYVCLSHCWGTTKTITTTTTNLAAFQIQIPWHALPLTYRDAIDFTRRLGFRYLWIDSLCIVQDDVVDWERESAKMADIYKGATLTIAAGTARGDNDGMYSMLDNSFPPVQALQWPDGLTSVNIYFTEHGFGDDDEGRHVASMGSTQDIEWGWVRQELPLISRGWVVQERLLSRRFTLFTSHELVWECAHETICECREISSSTSSRQDHGGTNTSQDLPKAQFWKNLTSHHSSTPAVVESPTLWSMQGKIWRDLVSYFVRRDLTFPTDRLPAISGLAKEYQKYAKCAYFAGLWETTLVQDLAWRCDGTSGGPVTRILPQQAPSWSWASVQCKHIYYNHLSLNSRFTKPFPIARVLGVKCRSASTGNEFGGPVSGEIRLRAPLVEARCVWKEEKPNRATPVLHATKGLWAKKISLDFDINPSGDLLSYVVEGELIYLVPLFGLHGTRLRRKSVRGHVFMLALKCIDKSARTFERFGSWEGHWYNAISAPKAVFTII